MTEVVTRCAPGTPCWVSLLARDPEKAKEFYGSLFGWRFHPAHGQFGGSFRAVLGDLEVAGIGTLPKGRRLPVAWTPYLSSDGADATAELIREHCGTVAVGPIDSGDAARMAIAADPAGAVFGVWEPREHGGTEMAGEPGTVAWNELVSRDHAFLASFYAAVFGYQVVPAATPFLERHQLLVEGRPVAAITSMGGGFARRPPVWMTYFAVADADAATREAVRLGGRVVRRPWDSPYGRMATITDPEGASFSVIESPKPV